MKIVIADDEYYVRIGLVKMLEEILTEEYSIIEVENGHQVLDKIREIQPNVVFLDIKMPRMSGLEAFQQAYGLSPETQWIVISGYADFEYARKALQLGAVDYLLKPVSPEQLELITADIRKRMLAQTEVRCSTFKQNLTAVFNRTLSLRTLPEGHELKQLSYVPILFALDRYVEKGQHSEELTGWYTEMENAVQQLNNRSLRAALVVVPGGTVGIMLGWDREDEHTEQWVMQSAYGKINKVLGRLSGGSLGFYALAGEPCAGLQELEAHIAIIEAALLIKALLARNDLIRWKELSGLVGTLSKEAREWSRALVELADTYRKKDYYRYVMLSRGIGSFLDKGYDSLPIQARNHAGSFLNNALSTGTDPREKSLPDAAAWRQLLERGEKELLRDTEGSTDMIDRVVEYIERNYAEDIGVAGVAEIFSITPNYLSSLFHKKTGSTFVKYVTHLRIAKAKELLAGHDLQVQEVAAAVGFNSPKHFAKLFKEHSGSYPSEFRAELRAK
ncbi:two-component system, response regulator YesN [Paenibacillus sp. ov031]|uniref:response regulator transcription factor n=1 Tax=Paenibacillus sp. ov031 TaxID=1761879 RepID=UPI00091433BA|nr:response regulator [Paenibacillus sp. ov031]SHN60034.1 two-component system, response regulator YesN [Paenibacillus sp. ov031]